MPNRPNAILARSPRRFDAPPRPRALPGLGRCRGSLGGRAQAKDATADLKKILDEAWQFQLREDPLFATQVGEMRYNDRLPSVAPADYDRRAAYARQTLERLKAIDRAALSDADRVNYDMFRAHGERRPRGARVSHLPDAPERRGQLPQRLRASSRHRSVLHHQGLRELPRTSARLSAYARQHTENMREGLRTGFVQPKAILKGFEDTITTHLVTDVEKSVFWKPFASFPRGVAEADRERLRAEGRAAIQKDVLPTYQAFLEFMTKEYIPGARASIGGVRAAPGAGILRLVREALHDPRRDPRRGARPRPQGGRAHPGRDGRGAEADQVGEELRRLPGVPAHRPALLSRRAPRSC